MNNEWDEPQKPWEGRRGLGWSDPPKHPWAENLRSFGWPECGDTEVSVEDLYQAFKERLLAEIATEHGDKLRDK